MEKKQVISFVGAAWETISDLQHRTAAVDSPSPDTWAPRPSELPGASMRSARLLNWPSARLKTRLEAKTARQGKKDCSKMCFFFTRLFHLSSPQSCSILSAYWISSAITCRLPLSPNMRKEKLSGLNQHNQIKTVWCLTFQRGQAARATEKGACGRAARYTRGRDQHH